MPIYHARDLLTLRDVGAPEGKPRWMNLHAAIRAEWKREPEALKGPGLYGVFLDGALFYIGLYAGHAAAPFGGSVLERWFKHATHHTLRSPKCEFRPSHLRDIMSLQGPVREDIAACLPEDLSTLDSRQHALVAPGSASTTFRKARFAARHWDLLGPGNETAMLDALSFVYCPLPRDWAASLPPAAAKDPKAWIKSHWLRPAETALISTFAPICNSPVAPGEEGPAVDPAMVEAATLAHIAAMSPAAQSAAAAPAPRADIAAIDDEDDDGEEMARLRTLLSPAGDTLLDALAAADLPGITIGATDRPDLRLYSIVPKRRVLMTLAPRANGWLRCETLASAASGIALGLDAQPLVGAGPMQSSFSIDPATTDAALLIAIAGAAVQTLSGD